MLGGAVQFWPVLEYTPWSPRAGGKGWEHAISYSMPPEELVNTYLPQFSGILDNYTGRNGIHFHSEYIGAAVLVFILYNLATIVPAVVPAGSAEGPEIMLALRVPGSAGSAVPGQG